MTTTIITKNSSTASAVPLAADLVQGELAVNVTDKRVYTKNASAAVVELGATPSSVTTGAVSCTTLATSGNVTLGDASTDTLNVGNGGLIKDASGNVGIGTSSPSFKLDVVGTLRSTGEARFDNAINLKTATLNQVYFDDAVAFTKNGTGERMRLDTSGNFMVGTTNNYTAARLSLERSNADIIGLRGNSSGTGIRYDTIQNTGTVAYFTTNTNTQVAGQITISGSSTTYATSSDYRLKENIAPMSDALSVVQQLKPCTYNWKVDGSDGQGFIAHELQAVVPDCVIGEKDAVDEEGNPKYQGIDTSFLVATLTAAIQEQQALITTLTERITALEAK